jgi:DNA replication protein DnaC
MWDDIHQPPETLASLQAFSQCPRGYLLLIGRNGTGKTYAAQRIYDLSTPYKLPAYDHDVAIFTTQTALNIVWSGLEGKTGELLRKYCDTQLLVLDDLGTRVPSEAFMDFLYAVADTRYSSRHDCGTIITTNLSSQSMRDKFGDAFTSRVASGRVHRFDGVDRRFNSNGF